MNDPTQETAPAEAGLPAAPSLQPDQLLQLARGFSRVFWGIPVSLLLLLDALNIQFLHAFRLPTYIIGVLLIYWGFTSFQRAMPISRRWPILLRRGFMMLFLQIYFAPFVYWWRNLPTSDYHLYNMIALLACMMITLLIINRLAGELADQIGDRTFRIESNLCAASVVLLMIVPLTALVGRSVLGVIRFDTSFHMELIHTHQHLTRWTHALFLLPLTLTMVLTWKAKERCLKALQWRAVIASPELEPDENQSPTTRASAPGRSG